MMRIARNVGKAIAVATLLFAGAANADTWVTGVTVLQAITALSGTTQYVQIVPNGSTINPASCTGTGSYFSTALPSNTLAIALAAFVGGKQLKLLVSSSSCYLTGPQFTAIGIM